MGIEWIMMLRILNIVIHSILFPRPGYFSYLCIADRKGAY